MHIDQFTKDIDDIINSEVNIKGSAIAKNNYLNNEMTKYLKNNLSLINNDDLIKFLKNDKNENSLIIMSCVSKESTEMIWEYAKNKNNDMFELFEYGLLFNNLFGWNESIVSELIDMDVNILLKPLHKTRQNLLTHIISSSRISSDFLLNKKDSINNADDVFKKKFIEYLSNIASYFSNDNEKENLIKLIVNVDDWNNIESNALRNMLYSSSRLESVKRKRYLSIISKSFNSDFFKKNNVDIEKTLSFSECIPTKKFIKICSEYTNINTSEWNALIDFSNVLFDKKMPIEEKKKKLCSYSDKMNDEFFNQIVSFYVIENALNKNEDIEEFIFKYREIKKEKNEIEDVIYNKELKDKEINKKRL